jgi:ketosteroid isomerase-like protein
MNTGIINTFKAFFSQMNLDELSALENIYSKDIVFKDPVHELRGIEELRRYYTRLNSNLISGSIMFSEEAISGSTVYLSWEMHLKLRRPRKELRLQGVSMLIVQDTVVFQRDFFDAGELFYEQVPVLGSFIRFIKKQITG